MIPSMPVMATETLPVETKTVSENTVIPEDTETIEEVIASEEEVSGNTMVSEEETVGKNATQTSTEEISLIPEAVLIM